MDLVPTLQLPVYRLQMADYLGKQEELDAQNEGQLSPFANFHDDFMRRLYEFEFGPRYHRKLGHA